MHFGYNCINYLPWFEKCSVLIEKRKEQKEILDIKWLSIKDALIYSRLLKLDLWDLIEKKKVKVEKKGRSMRIGFEVAWQYDECPLAHGGGQCGYFEEHENAKISCTQMLNEITEPHPNTVDIPDESEIKSFEQGLRKMYEQTSSKRIDGQLF